MAIYYSNSWPAPVPGSPNTSLPQWVAGDWYVFNNNGYQFKTSPIKTWSKPIVAANPPTSAVPIVTSTTLVALTKASQNQPINFNAVTAYGGAAIASSYTTSGTFVGYNISISPALPAGLSANYTYSVINIPDLTNRQWLYNSVNVAITGTPTVATIDTTYTVTFTDAIGQKSSTSFDLSIAAAGVSTLTSSLSGNKTSYSFIEGTTQSFVPVTASGGTAPYTWSINPSLAGTGLSFDSTSCTITGIPSKVLTNVSYTITVKDTSLIPQTSSQTIAITTSATPLVSTVLTPTKTLTQKIAFTPFNPVTVTGGYGANTYTINPGLPNGLTFSSNGLISGTSLVSSAAGNYTISITDSNTPNTTTTGVFNLSVSALSAVVATVNQSQQSTTINSPINTTPVSGSGGYGTLSYSISPALPSGLTFNVSTGAITGTPTQLSGNTTYTVTITDQSTTPQVATGAFTLSVTAVSLTTTQSISIISVTDGVSISNFSTTGYKPVTASGGYGNYTYTLSGNNLPTGLYFTTSNGAITGTSTVPQSSKVYTVTVTDQTTPTPQSASNTFNLIASAPPVIIVTQNQSNSINLTQGVASSFTPVTASGGYSNLTYSISPNLPPTLTINVNTGVITGTPATYSLTPTTYTIAVKDGAGQTVSNTFSLITNTVPFVKTSTVPSQTVITGLPITTFAPILVSGGAAPYTFTSSIALPTGLSLNSTTGYITGTPTVSGTNTFTVTATDAAGQTLTQSTTLTVNNSVSVTTNVVSNFVNDSFIVNLDQVSFTPVTASGGSQTITFSITPNLPTGLQFNSSNGYIYGVASQLTSNTSYKITATDGITNSNSSFNLQTIVPPLKALTSTSSVTLTSHVAITPFTPVNYIGGTPPVSYSSTLPTGLNIVSANGYIYGTPNNSQSSTPITITITDAANKTVSNTFNLTINAPANLTTSVSSPISATYGVTFNSIPVQSFGGYGANTYAISGNTLPTGLTFNTSNGAITGTPTSLQYSNTYTVVVTDSIAQTNTNTFIFSSLPPALNITVTPSITFTQYKSSTATPVVGTGGFGNLKYAVTAGTLPAGLTLNTTTGQITGVPTATSSNSITISVTDDAGQTSPGTVNLVVSSFAPPALVSTLTQSDYTYTQGQLVNFTPVTASGGYLNPNSSDTYVYTLSGNLPDGLNFHTSSGIISGLAAATSNTLTYTVTANDDVPQYTSQSFTLTIVAAAITGVDSVYRNDLLAVYNSANTAYALAQNAYGLANVDSTIANNALITAQSAFNKINNYSVLVQSNVDNIIAGSTLSVAVDLSNNNYPGGLFTIYQQPPMSFTLASNWSSTSTSTKDAYANSIANIVNTSNIVLSLTLANATFNIQGTDTITLGDTIITGANLISLGITGSGGTYTISSANLNSSIQTNATSVVSCNLTTTRNTKAASSVTLYNTAPTPFNVTFGSASFTSSTVPYFNTNLSFNWNASATGTVSGGTVTYAPTSGGAPVTLTSTGVLSGTSGSIQSNVSYIITSTNTNGYNGSGLHGAGSRTIPNTITTTVSPTTVYWPIFHKVTQSSANPNFVTSDSNNGVNYVLGQGATTTNNVTDYFWIAVPGSGSHTFGFTFLGAQAVTNPNVTYLNQTIGGYPYNVYGFTNYNAPTLIYTTS